MSEAARRLLASPSRKPPSPGDKWFADHPEAADFVLEWARMRAAGETDWSNKALLRYLQENHGFPFAHRDAIERWLKRPRRPTEEK